MKNSIVVKIILFIGGAMFVGVGIGTLFFPVDFVARNGVDVAGNISLLNDIRGSGGVLLGAGIIMLLGIIHSGMTFTSTVVQAVLYTLFGIGRAVSILTDGAPADGLVKATVVETVVGLLAIFALIRFRNKTQASE